MEQTIDMQPTTTLSVVGQQYRALIHITLVVLALTVLYCGAVLATTSEGVMTFMGIGTRFSDGDPDGTVGYDGQFVYFIARDGADAIPYIDGPTLRYQRIILPLVGRVLALGQPDLVPWALLVTNVLAHSIGAGLIGYLVAGSEGPGRVAGLIYGLWIGGLFSVRFTLTESLCMMLALAAIIAYSRERYRWTIVLLMLSTLTKEIGLVFAAGLALHALTQRKIGWAVLILGGPTLLFLAWWKVMQAWLSELPTKYPAARDIQFVPLNGMFSVLPERGVAEFILVALWVGIPAAILLLLILATIVRKRTLHLSSALALAGVGFVMVMPGLSWQDQAAVYRVGIPLVVGGLLFMGQHFPRLFPWLLILWGTPLSILLVLSFA